MCMRSIRITISAEAYKRLKAVKNLGETFSDVILGNLCPPARTCGEILEQLEKIKGPFVDQALMGKVKAGRRRRSTRVKDSQTSEF